MRPGLRDLLEKVELRRLAQGAAGTHAGREVTARRSAGRPSVIFGYQDLDSVAAIIGSARFRQERSEFWERSRYSERVNS